LLFRIYRGCFIFTQKKLSFVHPKKLSIQDFTYTLPNEKIASHPLPERDTSKLLIYENRVITTDVFKNISEHIPENSLLVFNNTKVVEARLLFQKESGGAIELFCLEPHEMYADVTTAMSQTGSVKWLCLVGGASKWKKGNPLYLPHSNERNFSLKASMTEKRSDCYVIQFDWGNPAISFAEILHTAGNVPLPPYIKRKAEKEDAVRYQTVYAQFDGSVAAPTAGLHFTKDLFKKLGDKKIKTGNVTLHVSAGTFKPVKAEKMEGHEMHAEYIDVAISLIETLLQNINAPVIAVGTTSLRTIESLYWMGCKLLQADDVSSSSNDLFLSQWEAYDLEQNNYAADTALNRLLHYLKENNIERLITKTQIIIAPGYHFKIVTGLITNFHQPTSTLLLLVSAFVGDAWKKVYEYALLNDFRFLSYGDSSLLWRK
jgi:S-adenosylmethionine:tRNA ribosyltransferase-isomerase